MTWTTIPFPFGSTLTSTKMTQFFDNLTAVANGDASAPNIQTAAIAALAVTEAKIAALAVSEGKLAASAVAQGKLKTTTGTVTSSTGAPALATLGGGEYGFYPQISYFGGGGNSAKGANIGGDLGTPNFTDTNWGTTYQTRIALLGDSNQAAQAQQRWVTASPPYDLGDGDVVHFIFSVVNAAGRVEMTYEATEPPWANNGPTVINPLGRMLRLANVTGKLRDAANDMARRTAYLAALAKAHDMMHSTDPAVIAQVVSVLTAPVTQTEKQADMPLIPHPFLGNNLTGKTVVLLDPMGGMTEELWLAKEYGGDSISEILHGDYLVLDADPLARAAPPGVCAIRARWKLTP